MKKPRSGTISMLGILLIVMLCAAVYQVREAVNDVNKPEEFAPATVEYGTHSTATEPMALAPRRHTAIPMVSGSAIHATAQYGRTASAPSGKGLHTTSSAQVRTIGSGGGYGGGISMSISSSSSSHRGINYGGVSVSMPTLAMNTSAITTVSATIVSSVSERMSRPGMRKAKPDYDGESGDVVTDGSETWTWDEDAEDWVNTTPTGTTRYNSTYGYMEYWNGSAWVKVDDQSDPNSPIGATPWILMAMMAVAYVWRKQKSKKQIEKIR